MSQEFTDKTQQEIEAYIQQSMQDKERTSFEQRLSEDDLLKEEVLLQQSIHQAFDEKDWISEKSSIEEAEVEKLSSKLNSDAYQKASQNIRKASSAYFEQQENKAAPKRLIPFYKVAVAASILLLLGILFLWPADSLESQYAALAHWEDVPSIIEKGDVVNDAIKGEELFQAEQYEEIINHFSTTDQLSPVSLIHLGIAYLELGDTNNALQTFTALGNSNSIESSRAYWYQLLVYLKKEDKEKVKETLATILSSEDNYNYKKALSLSKQWEEILK